MKAPLGHTLFVVVLWVCLVMTPLFPPKSQGRFHPYPPPLSPIVETLVRQIALTAGGEFRGRVATFTGRTKLDDRQTWFDLHGLDYKLIQQVGNDHRMVGLWFYNIPTLMEYSPLITPAFHVFAKTFLALPQDSQMRNVLTLRNPQPKFLAAMGVRFLVTDARLNGGTLRKTLTIPGFGELYLYEFFSPNLGQYSPAHVVTLSSIDDILAALATKDFDFHKDLIVSEPIDETLVPADHVTLSVNGTSFHVSASSSGTSAIVLPIEFSRCLNIGDKTAAGRPPRILRSNLMQTALVFDKKLDADIAYFSGPLRNSSCRLRDKDDFRRLLPK